MNPYLKLFLKLFRAAGVPFGIAITVLYAIASGILQGLIIGIFAGVLFGGLMSLILGSLHIWFVKRTPYRDAKDALEVYHTRSIELRLTFDNAFDLCIKSLKLIKGSVVQKEDRAIGKIEAKSGITWKTWGDFITFDVRKINDNATQVGVSSRPLVKTTVVDYGKNLENVERITAFLKKLI